MNVYLLAFNPESLSRELLTEYLNLRPYVFNWVTLLPGQIFIVSQIDLRYFSQDVRTRFPGKLFFMTQLTPRRAMDGCRKTCGISSASPPAFALCRT